MRKHQRRRASAILHGVEHPVVVVAWRKRQRRPVNRCRGVAVIINGKLLHAVLMADVRIDEVVQRLRVELPDDAIGEVADLPIPANLAGQTALESAPLTVNVIAALKARAVALDACRRFYVDGDNHLQPFSS